MNTVGTPSRGFLNRAKHQNFSTKKEPLHEISERTGDLQSETQAHQSGYLLNGAKHQNFSIDDTGDSFDVFQ
jgi:hypothetical protein